MQAPTVAWRSLRTAWRVKGCFTFDFHENDHVVWSGASLSVAIHAQLNDTARVESVEVRPDARDNEVRRSMFTVFPRLVAAYIRATSDGALNAQLSEACEVARPHAASNQPRSFLLHVHPFRFDLLWKGFLLGVVTGDDVHFVFGTPVTYETRTHIFSLSGRAAAHCVAIDLVTSHQPDLERAMPTNVLDDLDLAIFCCDAKGVIAERPNRRAFKAFGEALGEESGTTWNRPISDLLLKTDRDREAFTCTYAQFVDDILPFDFVSSMLPQEVAATDLRWAVSYSPTTRASLEDPYHVLVIARPLPEQEAGGSGDESNAYIKAMLTDIDVSRGFLVETNAMVAMTLVETDVSRLGRLLHTIKGNCGCFAMTDLAQRVHHVEDLLTAGMSEELVAGLADIKCMWDEKISLFQSMLKEDNSNVVITREEFDELNMDLMGNRDWSEILGVVQKWSMELVDVRFRRLELQLERFARQAEKDVKIVSLNKGTRLPRNGLQDFWGSLVHILRNVVDHGLDSTTERAPLGKGPVPTVTFGIAMTDDDAIITIVDDGHGIAWEKVRSKAKERGLPHLTPGDLADALFSQGLSTRDGVSLTAGRGVGLSAVKDEVTRLDGKVNVVSEAGKGTQFLLSLPLSTLANLQLTS